MKTQNKTQLILTIMNVLFWIAFIGLCVQTGTILFSFVVGLMGNQIATDRLYLEVNLTELYKLGLFHYLNIGLVLLISSGLKAYIAYLVIKISTKFNLQQPFNKTAYQLISQISYFILIIGILQACAQSYYKGLIKEGLTVPNLSHHFGNGGEFLFVAGIIFIIAQVFKRGLEIQSENELTI